MGVAEAQVDHHVGTPGEDGGGRIVSERLQRLVEMMGVSAFHGVPP
jgi:hypothetical protein